MGRISRHREGQYRVGTVSPDTGRYRQVAAELRRRIAAGVYGTGELPPASDLAIEFGIGVRTVQRALTELDRDGLTVGRQGRPRFVIGKGMKAATRYEQVAERIRSEIQAGILPPGGRLPSESQLVEQYGVSRATIREALDLLEDSGNVVKRSGRRYVAGSGAAPDLAYGRVAETIRARIRSGRYQPGSRLPGELTLADELSVSRPTVREALTRLGREGLLRSEPKRGWFVTIRASRRA